MVVAASSSPPPHRQRRAILGALLALAGGTALAAPAGRQTPSGLPVPRYVSTKFSTVNVRGGPGDDHRMLWIYHVRGLPLQVVAETDEWRRVCDPEGGLGWVHKRVLAETRTVMRTQGRDLLLRARPTETARAPAVLAARSIATLGKCERGWCRITADRTSGWVRSSEVWGVDPAPRCR